MNKYNVYILSNKYRTVLYIGYTEDLNRRLNQHKSGHGALFTKKYNATELIYVESFEDKKKAKSREKQLKNWHKDWKWDFIKNKNPQLKTIEI